MTLYSQTMSRYDTLLSNEGQIGHFTLKRGPYRTLYSQTYLVIFHPLIRIQLIGNGSDYF